MAGSTGESTRIDTRISTDHKNEINEAAGHMGMAFGSFVNSAAIEKARLVNQQARTVKLTARDFDALLALTENPPEPSEALIRLLGNG